MGIIGSVAGLPLQQSRGSDQEANLQNAAIQARRISAARQAEAAAGVGEAQHDHETGERDADGRRLWEHNPHLPADDGQRPMGNETTGSSRDASGDRGANLDLSG